jgi:hypothetical protein
LKINIDWLKRRWTEFRFGHNIYLVYLLSLFNFAIISYRLLVEYIPFLKMLFPSFTIYILILIICYPPTAIIIGRIHRKKQLKTDIMIQIEQNPVIQEILYRIRRIEEILNEEK